MAKVVKRRPRSGPVKVRPTSSAPIPEAPKGKPGKDFVDGGFFHQRRGEVVIGVDSSATAFAIAVLDTESKAYYGWVFRSKHKGAYRLVEIGQFVDSTVRKCRRTSEDVVHVCMEGYGFSRQMGHTLGEVGGQAKVKLIGALGFSNKVAYPTIVAPTALKKYVAGSGGKDIKKQHMLKALDKKWGMDVDDDNLADALGLCMLGRALHIGTTEFAYEADVVAKLERHTEWPNP